MAVIRYSENERMYVGGMECTVLYMRVHVLWICDVLVSFEICTFMNTSIVMCTILCVPPPTQLAVPYTYRYYIEGVGDYCSNTIIAIGFDQLCWHNFRIIGTSFGGISIEHNASIIGSDLPI